MSELEQYFHETWLGMVQPSEGLVVSVPVLVQAQCMERQPADAQRRLRACTEEGADGAPRLNDTCRVLSGLFGYPAEALVTDGLERHTLFVPEGRQVLGCTTVLRDPTKEIDLVLVWELPDNTDFDQPETVTGRGAIQQPPNWIGSYGIRASRSGCSRTSGHFAWSTPRQARRRDT